MVVVACRLNEKREKKFKNGTHTSFLTNETNPNPFDIWVWVSRITLHSLHEKQRHILDAETLSIALNEQTQLKAKRFSEAISGISVIFFIYSSSLTTGIE